MEKQKKIVNNKNYGFVYTVLGSLLEAQKIAQICLEQKLVACANIFPPILSMYEWNAQYQKEEEIVLLLKTRKDLFKELCKTIKDHHSYTCPCIVFLPITDAYSPFLSWMDSKVRLPSI